MFGTLNSIALQQRDVAGGGQQWPCRCEGLWRKTPGSLKESGLVAWTEDGWKGVWVVGRVKEVVRKVVGRNQLGAEARNTSETKKKVEHLKSKKKVEGTGESLKRGTDV